MQSYTEEKQRKMERDSLAAQGHSLVLFGKMGYNKKAREAQERSEKNMADREDMDIIELEGEDGEVLKLCVERYFFYNGEEYVLLSDDCGQNDGEEISHYVMKVQPLPADEDGEEMEEFVPVDEDLMDQLIQVVEATFDEEDE